MDFAILSDIVDVEVIARGPAVRDRKRLKRVYGGKAWRKMKGFARVRFHGSKAVSLQEIHWYEAHGIGKKEFKIKFR